MPELTDADINKLLQDIKNLADIEGANANDKRLKQYERLKAAFADHWYGNENETINWADINQTLQKATTAPEYNIKDALPEDYGDYIKKEPVKPIAPLQPGSRSRTKSAKVAPPSTAVPPNPPPSSGGILSSIYKGLSNLGSDFSQKYKEAQQRQEAKRKAKENQHRTDVPSTGGSSPRSNSFMDHNDSSLDLLNKDVWESSDTKETSRNYKASLRSVMELRKRPLELDSPELTLDDLEQDIFIADYLTEALGDDHPHEFSLWKDDNKITVTFKHKESQESVPSNELWVEGSKVTAPRAEMNDEKKMKLQAKEMVATYFSVESNRNYPPQYNGATERMAEILNDAVEEYKEKFKLEFQSVSRLEK